MTTSFITTTPEASASKEQATVYYPKCRASLSVVFDGFGGGDSEPMIVHVLPRTCQVYLNGYKEADTWELEFDANELPFDPGLIRSLAVQIYLFDSKSTDADVFTYATEENLLVTGLADNMELTVGKDGRSVKMDGRDYTALLADRQWDPRKKVPTGKLLTKVIEDLVNDGVNAAKHGQTLKVVWASSDPIPVVGKSATATKKNGTPVKDGSNYWDVIYRTCLRESKVVFVRGWEVVISDPQTLTVQSAAAAAKVAYGRNLSALKISRKLGKEKVPRIKVYAYNPVTRSQIVAVFPEGKEPVKTGIGTEKDEERVFTLRGNVSKAAVKKHAEAMYNNLARAEATVSFSTRSLMDLSEQQVNLLRLRAGAPVVVAFDPFNQEVLTQKTAEQRYTYLVDLGYSRAVASVVAEAYYHIAAWRVLYTQEVNIQWSHEEGVTIDVQAINFVSPERDDITGTALRGAKKILETVEAGVRVVTGSTTLDATQIAENLREEL